MLAADGVLGGSFTPHCAAVHPARLVRGLARRGRGGAACRSSSRPGARHPARPGRDRRRDGARRGRAARDRGLHAPAGRASARGGAGLLADGGDRAARRRDLGDRIGARRGPPDVHRRPAPDHLRPAHGRRPAGVRRPRGAVPLRVAHPPVVRRGAAGLRRAPRACCASCSRSSAERRAVHPRVGRLPRHPPRLGRVGRAGPRHRDRLGRRLRRRRGRHHEPRRPHARRPGHRRRQRPGRRCPGSTTGAGRGSRSRCAGSASTRGCVR